MALVTRDTLASLDRNADRTRVVIQGYGNVGSHAARFLQEMGCQVLAVSDIRGGIYSAGGLAPSELITHVEQTGSVVGFPGAEPISSEGLLGLDCDVLIPAALGGVIHADNWRTVQAPIIIEAANGPVTPFADHHLIKQGTVVVPDIVANAGGVLVSYFEWTQNIQQHRWTLDCVNEELELMLLGAYGSVRERAETEGITLRAASFIIGVERVIEAFYSAVACRYTSACVAGGFWIRRGRQTRDVATLVRTQLHRIVHEGNERE